MTEKNYVWRVHEHTAASLWVQHLEEDREFPVFVNSGMWGTFCTEKIDNMNVNEEEPTEEFWQAIIGGTTEEEDIPWYEWNFLVTVEQMMQDVEEAPEEVKDLIDYGMRKVYE